MLSPSNWRMYLVCAASNFVQHRYKPFNPLFFLIKALAIVVLPVPGPPSIATRWFRCKLSNASKLEMFNQVKMSFNDDWLYLPVSLIVGAKQLTTDERISVERLQLNQCLLRLSSFNTSIQKSAKEVSESCLLLFHIL